jgi:hypothetical protein
VHPESHHVSVAQFSVRPLQHLMKARAKYPKRPVRAALIAFFILSAFVGAFIPFDERIRNVWHFALGYCALLAVASIGLARLGRRAVLLLGVPAAVALSPGVVGIALMLRPGGSLDSGGVWLQVSLNLLYALAAWGICLVIRGWSLYFTKPHETA